jgi:hypothetical protein
MIVVVVVVHTFLSSNVERVTVRVTGSTASDPTLVFTGLPGVWTLRIRHCLKRAFWCHTHDDRLQTEGLWPGHSFVLSESPRGRCRPHCRRLVASALEFFRSCVRALSASSSWPHPIPLHAVCLLLLVFADVDANRCRGGVAVHRPVAVPHGHLHPGLRVRERGHAGRLQRPLLCNARLPWRHVRVLLHGELGGGARVPIHDRHAVLWKRCGDDGRGDDPTWVCRRRVRLYWRNHWGRGWWCCSIADTPIVKYGDRCVLRVPLA